MLASIKMLVKNRNFHNEMQETRNTRTRNIDTHTQPYTYTQSN